MKVLIFFPEVARECLEIACGSVCLSLKVLLPEVKLFAVVYSQFMLVRTRSPGCRKATRKLNCRA